MIVLLVVTLFLSVPVKATQYDADESYKDNYADVWLDEDQHNDFMHKNGKSTDRQKEKASRMLKDLKKKYADDDDEKYPDSWLSEPLKRQEEMEGEEDPSLYDDDQFDGLHDSDSLYIHAREEGVLLSLNKPTSSTIVRNGGVPERAVDGGTSGLYADGSCTHSWRKTNNWWKVELEATAKVDTILIYNRLDCCEDRIDGAQVFVGDELCDEITYVGGQAVYEMDCGGMEGDSVKVVQNENILSLCEVQVYGEVEQQGTIDDPAKSTKYYFGKTLEPGDYLEVYGTYVSGTNGFTVNIRGPNSWTYLLYISFRPTSSTVMNSYSKGWNSERISGRFPGFKPDEEFKITIVCMDDDYKIFVNDELIQIFPYRFELSTATYLWLEGGSNGFTWNSIKMPGDEKSDVYTLKDVLGVTVQSLANKITKQVRGKSLSKVKRYVNSKTGSLAILKFQLLKIINDRGEIMDITEDTISWILNDRETLETFMTSGDVEDNNYKKALEILAEIIRQDPGAKDDPLKRRLAVATGLTFANDIRSFAVYTNFIDGIAKYHTYVKWAAENLLFGPFYEVSAWHLRYVIDSRHETEELIWARANVGEEYKSADKIFNTGMVEYKMVNDKGVDIGEGPVYYDYEPTTLKKMHEVGGVCGAISNFHVGMAQAFGIPALPVRQPGHCAYMWYKIGTWTLNNNLDITQGWVNTYINNQFLQYTWMRPAAYFPLMNGAQENLAGYRLSEKMRISSKMANAVDVFEILEDASTVCPENFAVWVDMEDALNEPTLEVESVQNLLQSTLASFRESIAKNEISNIAAEKKITSTCNNESSDKITDDGNDSAWCCFEETATFEIDFGRLLYTIDEIQIKWYRRFKPNTYTIFALSESGEYSIVKTKDDERTEGEVYMSYLTGWDMKTRKIKVQLDDSVTEPGQHRFTILQFRVLGFENDVVSVISKGKQVTVNPESSGADALLDDNDSTIWDSSKHSWFEINLGGICALDDVEFEWVNEASPVKNLEVSYKVGSGDETDITEDGAVEQVELDMNLASTIKVKLEGGDHSLAGVKVCGVAYSIKDILKIKVSSTLSKYYRVKHYLMDAIDGYEYDN